VVFHKVSIIITGTLITYRLGGAGKVPELLPSLVPVDLGQSASLSLKGLCDAGARINPILTLGSHDLVLSLSKGCLLGRKGEVLEAWLGCMTVTGTGMSLLVLAR
jgi:hypothetical protein